MLSTSEPSFQTHRPLLISPQTHRLKVKSITASRGNQHKTPLAPTPGLTQTGAPDPTKSENSLSPPSAEQFKFSLTFPSLSLFWRTAPPSVHICCYVLLKASRNPGSLLPSCWVIHVYTQLNCTCSHIPAHILTYTWSTHT